MREGRDTGKIIYASMKVNGEEINLYNFKDKNNEEYYDIKGKSITKSLMKIQLTEQFIVVIWNEKTSNTWL